MKDGPELLYRQMTEPLWDAAYGQPVTTAFGPMPADEYKPSFVRSSKVSPQASRDWHTKNVRHSFGVWACSVQAVMDATLRAIDDSGVETEELTAPGHAYVDYRGLSRVDRKAAKAALLADALARGAIATTATATP